MPEQVFPTANSRTPVAFDSNWLVLDIGSGHNPHPRADICADKFLFDDTERSGQHIVLPEGKAMVVADVAALPFKDKAFDFVVVSHVLEHVEDIDRACEELVRTARRGYLETPGKLAETLRHSPQHRWMVSGQDGGLRFLAVSPEPPLGWFGILFWSVYFYDTVHAAEGRTFFFAARQPKPWHYGLRLVQMALFKLWRLFKPWTYTRLYWKDRFSWTVDKGRR